MKSLKIFILTLWATTVEAAPIAVQSGQHEEFTRLVVYLQPNQIWTLDGSEDRVFQLTLDDWSQSFDVKAIFNKITTKHLKSVSASSNQLRLNLNCDCIISPIELPHGFLQLDIKEIAAKRPIQRPENTTSQKPENVERQLEQNDESSNIEVWRLERINTDLPKLTSVIEASQSKTAQAFGRNLVEEIARGATLEHLQTPQQNNIRQQVKSDFKSDIASNSGREELLRLLGRRARISDTAGENNLLQSDDLGGCSIDPRLQVSTWANEDNYHDQLAKLRSELFDETGVQSLQKKSELIRLHLFFGLLPEALQMMRDLNNPTELQNFGIVASALGAETQPEIFEKFNTEGCESEPLFWAVLANGEGQEVDSEIAKALLDTFKSLPIHLQKLTANKLNKIMVENDLGTELEILKNVLKRADEPDQLTSATAFGPSDLRELAASEIRDLIEKNQELAPKALLALLQKSIDEEEPISQAEIELAGAFAFQLDGSQLAAELRSVEVISLAKSQRGNFAREKLNRYIQEKRDISPGTVDAVAQEFLLTGSLSELSQFFGVVRRNGKIAELAQDTKVKLAGFFSTGGLPELSEMVLQGSRENSSEAIETARAYQKQGRTREALEVLAGVNDPPAREKYLELLMLYEPEQAWSTRGDVSEDQRSMLAWRTRNWDDVSEGSIRSQVARRISESSTKQKNWTKPISSSREISSESKKTVSAILELLADEQS